MDLDFKILSKSDALALDPKTYNPEEHPYGNLRLESAARVRGDEAVAIVALDRSVIVGKILLRYASIPFEEGILRLALGQDMLVSPDYRGRGIGTALIEKSLEVEAPTIHSGLSGLSRPLFEKFALPSIDRSQAYQLPLSWKGFLRAVRDSGALARESRSGFSAPGQLVHDSRTWRSQLHRTRSLASSMSRPLCETDALAALSEILSPRVRRFQIPWNLTKLRAGLANVDSDFCAIVTDVTTASKSQRFLITAYRYPRKIRLPFTKTQRPLDEWRVNEIYPPVVDSSLGQVAVASIATRLAQRGADVMEIFCHTAELELACADLGLRKSLTKSMLLVPPRSYKPELACLICNPNEWWCRAMNEEQFEESQEGFDTFAPDPLDAKSEQTSK